MVIVAIESREADDSKPGVERSETRISKTKTVEQAKLPIVVNYSNASCDESAVDRSAGFDNS